MSDLILRSPVVRRAVMSAGALMVVVLSVLGASVMPAAAQGERAGNVVVTSGNGSGDPLEDGGSATVFGLALPSEAECQGDSAHDDYRVKSFLVPDGTEPGSLVYDELKPVAPNSWSLWAESTDPYVNGLTSQADPGQPGPINNVPRFTFSVLFPGEMPAGSYRIGILCYHDNQTTRYWDTAFVISADTNDQPAQFRWSAPPAGGSGSGSSADLGRWTVVGLVVGLVIAAALYVVIRRRPSTSSPSPIQEEIT